MLFGTTSLPSAYKGSQMLVVSTYNIIITNHTIYISIDLIHDTTYTSKNIIIMLSRFINGSILDFAYGASFWTLMSKMQNMRKHEADYRFQLLTIIVDCYVYMYTCYISFY